MKWCGQGQSDPTSALGFIMEVSPWLSDRENSLTSPGDPGPVALPLPAREAESSAGLEPVPGWHHAHGGHMAGSRPATAGTRQSFLQCVNKQVLAPRTLTPVRTTTLVSAASNHQPRFPSPESHKTNLLLPTVLPAGEHTLGAPRSLLFSGPRGPGTLHRQRGGKFSVGPAPAPPLCSGDSNPLENSCRWGSPPTLAERPGFPAQCHPGPPGATYNTNLRLRSHLARWVSSVGNTGRLLPGLTGLVLSRSSCPASSQPPAGCPPLSVLSLPSSCSEVAGFPHIPHPPAGSSLSLKLWP